MPKCPEEIFSEARRGKLIVSPNPSLQQLTPNLIVKKKISFSFSNLLLLSIVVKLTEENEVSFVRFT